jgi:hypothetical protein
MKNVFLILGIIFIANQTFASNGAVSIVPQSNNYQKLVSDIQTNSGEDWKVLLDRKDVSIYYSEVKGNKCLGYKLKIVNHSNEQKIISFGILGKLNDECRSLYADYGSFQARKIPVNSNETIVGSDKITALLLPNTNGNIPVEVLMQNLNIQ